MWPFSLLSKPHSERLGQLIHEKFASKVSRGMRIRTVGDSQILLEDTDEWLDRDCEQLKLVYKERLHFDVYSCMNYETSISGLCVCVTVVPHSCLWDFIGIIMLIFIYSTFLAWALVLSKTHKLLDQFAPSET